MSSSTYSTEGARWPIDAGIEPVRLLKLRSLPAHVCQQLEFVCGQRKCPSRTVCLHLAYSQPPEQDLSFTHRKRYWLRLPTEGGIVPDRSL